MTDKEKIRAYIESQIALLEKNDTGNPVFGVSAGVVMAELKHLLSFIDNLQEEPVSEGLEEAAKNVGKKYFPDESNIWARPNYEAKAAEYAFKDGANWQKEQMMRNAISMDVYYETEWDDIHKFLRKNLDGEKVKLTIIKEE